MKKVIVTGGAGFIGSNLVDFLIKRSIDVIILDDLSTGKEENININSKFFNVDIADLRPNSKILKKMMDDFAEVDVIFHVAAKARVQPSIDDPISYNKANVDGTLNMLCLAKEIGVKRFVYSASSSAYGNAIEFPTSENHKTSPISPYGLQKYIGEQYCKVFNDVYGIDTVSLRYFNVYGERMLLEGAYCLVIGAFAKALLEGKKMKINNTGEQRRDFTYVGDVVNANFLAASYEKKLNGEVFNIGNGSNFSVNEVAAMFGGQTEKGENVLEPFETLSNSSKAKKVLGWETRGNLSKWIRNYKNELNIK